MAMVRMTHPTIPNAEPALTTDDAFEKVWEPNGWERADQVVITAGAVLAKAVPDLGGLTKAELLQVAANVGAVGVGQRTTNDEIIAAIREVEVAPDAFTAVAAPPTPASEEGGG
jgi:hypothetical protein